LFAFSSIKTKKPGADTGFVKCRNHKAHKDLQKEDKGGESPSLRLLSSVCFVFSVVYVSIIKQKSPEQMPGFRVSQQFFNRKTANNAL